MIGGGGSMARLRARFRDQFAPVANGYLYRRNSRGSALPVSAGDAHEFIAAFERATRWLSWGGVLAAAAMFGTVEAIGVRWPSWLAPYGRGVLLVAFMLVWGALFYLVWNAPWRILNGRAPVAPALSGSQVRRQGLRTLPWRMLALGALISAGLAVRVAVEPDPLGPANRGYLVWAAVLLLFFGALAVAKRRAG